MISVRFKIVIKQDYIYSRSDTPISHKKAINY